MNGEKMKNRRMIFSGIAGIGTAFCLVAGKSLDVYYTLNLKDKAFYLKLALCSIILSTVVYAVWTLAPKADKKGVFEKLSSKIADFEGRIKGWMILLFLLVMWMPAWFSIFPGVFSYDAYDEWLQIYKGELTAHHPVLHVLWLGGLTEGLYRLTGSYNVGIAAYVFVQMLLLAATFVYTIQFMRERRVAPGLRLFAILFYGASPVVQLFAICGTKDTIFAAAFLLFVISLWRVCVCREAFFKNKKWQRLFCISALGAMIMRNNGLYAVIAMLVLLFPLCWRYVKKYLGLVAAIVLIYAVYVGPFYSMLQVTPGGVQEMLSVPLQQLARVYHYDKNFFTEEEQQYLHTVVAEENWQQYRSTVSDFVKAGFQQEVYEENPSKFWRLWLRTGIKNPMTYINSFLLGIVDYWYPFAIVDGYQDVYGASSYFDYKVSEPGTEQVFFPGLHRIYEGISLDKEVQKQPGMFLVLSPGWYLLLFLHLFLYLWYRKRYKQLVPLLAILLYFGTVLLGPIALVRYVLILYYAFPIYCVFVCEQGQE